MAAFTAETAARQSTSARLGENIDVDQHSQPGLRGEGPSSSSSASFAVVTKAEDNLRARHLLCLCTSPSGYRGSAEHEGAQQVTAAREVEQCSRYVAAAVKRVRADHAGIPARAFPLFVPRACLRSPSTMQHRLDLAVRSLLLGLGECAVQPNSILEGRRGARQE